MSTPEKPQNGRVSALPAPELVSLADGATGPQDAIQAPWWVAYGGTRDEASGVIKFPPRSLPPCPFPCAHCQRREGA